MSIGLLTMNHRIPRDGAISCYFKDNVQDIVFTNSNLKLIPIVFFSIGTFLSSVLPRGLGKVQINNK